MFRHLLKLIFGHHHHHCGVAFLAVGLTLIAGSAMACGVAVGSFAVAQPAFVAAPQAVYQSSIGVACGQQVAVAAPQAVYAAPIAVQAVPAFVLPSYNFAVPFVSSSSLYGSSFVGSAFVGSHVGFDARLNEHRAVRLNARAQHAAIRAQR